MTESLRLLVDQLRDCLVKIADDGDDMISAGSGFWVSPGLVITCAHVLSVSVGSTVRVTWQGKQLVGVVHATEPAKSDDEFDLWPYPDLAIIKVNAAPDHPCAWICEDEYLSGTPVSVLGHSSVLQGLPMEREAAGRIGGRDAFGSGWNWQLIGNEIGPGMSGGPVLNHNTGAVCGVMSTSRATGTDRGGYLVPIEGLRMFSGTFRSTLLDDHDQFHAAHQQWTLLRGQILNSAGADRGSVTAEQETELLGSLRVFSTTVDAPRMYAEFAISARRPARELKTLRDSVYALMDEPKAPQGQLSSFLRLTDALSRLAPDHSTRESLRDWTTTVAAKGGEETPLRQWRAQVGRQRPDIGYAVIVQIESGALDPNRYQTTIWVHRSADEIIKLFSDTSETRTLAETKEVICEQLRDVLSLLDDEVRVEFVTTVDLFDERFDELVPTRPYTNLGRKYPVVVRDLDRVRDATSGGRRRRDISTVQDWRRRWHHLKAGVATGPHWLECRGLPDESEFSASLQERPVLAVIALTRGPANNEARRALEVALDHGLPAAVWRRRCPEHDEGLPGASCTGARFRDGFTSVSAQAQLRDLPGLVHRERVRMRGDQTDACHDTVLLWDDPDRLPEPFVPLRLAQGNGDPESGLT